jgi:hypothetical protein
VLAIAGPFASAEQTIGCLAQARAGVARISGQQRKKSSGQASVITVSNGSAISPHGRNLRLEAIVVRKLEVERNWPASELDAAHIDPDRLTAAVDQKMIEGQSSYEPCRH